MIIYANDPGSDDEALTLLRDYIRDWFRNKYGSLTPPQRIAIPWIKRGYNVLISSPTGSGKTLAAFIAILDELYGLWEKNELRDEVYVLYVSPLRALNNDMRRNLIEPLNEINELLRQRGIEPPEIRVSVRTSDTTSNEKRKMLNRPPHILITTPETLAITLVAPKFRERLKSIRWVIVDEIHELASSKRGTHLSLSLERLRELTEKEFQRIGLSATINPLDTVARFLVGYDDTGNPRNCVIVDARFSKPIDIKVVCPNVDLIRASAEEINQAIYSTVAETIKQYRTTLIFTNTRHSTEKVVFKLRKIFEKSSNGISPDKIEAHHGSLSRDLRLDVEERLKRGDLRVVVSSTSLELGIDIGYIDAVILLSSPKSVTRLLQRVGRAGHHIRQVSIGRLIVVDRDDLIECTVLAKAAKERKLDRVKIPMKPLDILAQHLIGMSIEKKWRVDEALRVIRRSYPYHDLDKETLINLLKYLSSNLSELEHLKIYSKLWFDEAEGVFGRKRGARMIYALNSGAIPDEAKIPVINISARRWIGDLDEGFAEILERGDIFVLGGKVYKVIDIEPTKIYVVPADGERPTVPSWFSEMLPLAFDSALKVGAFRRKIATELLKVIERGDLEDSLKKIIDRIAREYDLDKHAAEMIVEYILEQIYYTGGIVPSDKLILVEHFTDPEKGADHLIFHTLYGRRVNDALSRAYAYVLGRLINADIRITVTDNGFILSTPMKLVNGEDVVKKLISSVNSRNLRDLLRRALRNTEIFRKRFRHVAERSIMILKNYRGKEISIDRRQINSDALLRVVEKINGFPVYEETMREIMEDYMDIENASLILGMIERGDIEIKYFKDPEDVKAPSPMAHGIYATGISDVVLMEDRRAVLIKLYNEMLEYLKRRKSQLLLSVSSNM
ncbi:MAG: ATP-dependent helicase [Sulfolobales archaeon]